MNIGRASIQLFGLFALMATFDPQQARAQWVLDGYVCAPTSCLNIADGVGFFSSSISIIGTWVNPAGGGKGTKKIGASTTVSSLGCTQPVTIEGVAYQTSNPVLGGGILADSTGSQGDVTLIEVQKVRYFSGSTGFVHPSPVVPCK